MSFKKVPTPTNLVGVGLRSPYISHIIKNSAQISKKIGWFEVHSENYYAENSSAVQNLLKIRSHFPVSLHCVGNSLGSAQRIDLLHLQKLKNLVDQVQPFLISDHISWGKIGDQHLNDLLPLCYTKESLTAICDNIDLMQNFLKHQILVENPSSYLAFTTQEMDEADFINQIAKKTGCGLLLDVNNIFVSSKNCQQFKSMDYISKINPEIVQEIHLAGHSISQIFDGKNYQEVLIDTHNNLVRDEVWEIYKAALQHFGKTPSLIEWDQDFPEFKVLLNEAKKAERILQNV